MLRKLFNGLTLAIPMIAVALIVTSAVFANNQAPPAPDVGFNGVNALTDVTGAVPIAVAENATVKTIRAAIENGGAEVGNGQAAIAASASNAASETANIKNQAVEHTVSKKAAQNAAANNEATTTANTAVG